MDLEAPGHGDDALFRDIRTLQVEARAHVARSINTTMVRTYWTIGGLIDDLLAAESRSESYGTDLMGHVSAQLTEEFGTGFDPTNLSNMQRVHQAFDIRDAASLKSLDDRVPIDVSLSWTHFGGSPLSKIPLPGGGTTTKPSLPAGALGNSIARSPTATTNAVLPSKASHPQRSNRPASWTRHKC